MKADKKENKADILILGGGAAGTVAAIAAARERGSGEGILILEKNQTLGKKLLATGNGRCNFTNAACTHKDLPTKQGNTDFSVEILKRLSPKALMEFFDGLGVYGRTEEAQRVYPYSGQGKAVAEALSRELSRLRVTVQYETWVKSIERGAGGFFVTSQDGRSFFGKKLILSVGGKAGLQYGSTGDGYPMAKMLSHKVIKPIPALVPLLCEKEGMAALKGVRTRGSVHLFSGERELAWEEGEIQFTAEGLSGICIFNLSRYVRFKDANQGEDPRYVVYVDFFPHLTGEEVLSLLIRRAEALDWQMTGDFLTGLLHDKLAPWLLREAGLSLKKPVKTLKKKELSDLSVLLKGWAFPVSGTKSFKEAQVTCGGVSTEEVNPKTLESRLTPGLYFAGELLDVDGKCGGYNLQWAFGSGYVAGENAGKELNAKNT